MLKISNLYIDCEDVVCGKVTGTAAVDDAPASDDFGVCLTLSCGTHYEFTGDDAQAAYDWLESKVDKPAVVKSKPAPAVAAK